MNTVEKINTILKEANISKVNLAKYLGVSRQMVYNYLDGEDLSKLSNDKSQALFTLLDVKNEEELKKIWFENLFNTAVEKALIKQKKSNYSFRNTDLESAKEQWDEVLNDAVLRSLISDNEINMSVSAGYDSNYIMYIANKVSNAHINAFSVGGIVGKQWDPTCWKEC